MAHASYDNAPTVTVEEERMALNFFTKIVEEGRGMGIPVLNLITSPIPQSTVGCVSRVYSKLFSTGKVITGVKTFCALALNMYTVTWYFILVLHEDGAEFSLQEDHNWNTTLTEEGIRVCHKKTNECNHHRLSRFHAYRASCFAEFFVVFPLGILIFVNALLIITCPSHFVPPERPWFLIFAPQYASCFSCLIFLSFVSLTTFFNIIFYNEAQMWYEVFFCSLWPRRNKKERGCLSKAQWNDYLVFKIGVALSMLILFLFAFQSLLVKLSILHFASITDFRDWSLHDWVIAMGFINQMAGVYSIWSDDLSRLLMFKFAGSESTFQPEECFTVAKFFSAIEAQLFYAVQDQLSSSPPVQQAIGRLGPILLLSTFNAADLNRLLLSQHREAHSSLARELRCDVLRRTWESFEAEKYLEQLNKAQGLWDERNYSAATALLEASKKKRIEHLAAERDKLLCHALSSEQNSFHLRHALRSGHSVQSKAVKVAPLLRENFHVQEAEVERSQILSLANMLQVQLQRVEHCHFSKLKQEDSDSDHEATGQDETTDSRTSLIGINSEDDEDDDEEETCDRNRSRFC